ncbi:hypothetical protein PIB30_038140 [Stylosanthes scabra]|uniref:Uncharacterized protein n=1 Tax=Stylosanthes scabra TaxID=79078 RepID=A0ABU6VCW2_9FABA|nr:hypothetical protein [Stylosanthes scabra]
MFIRGSRISYVHPRIRSADLRFTNLIPPSTFPSSLSLDRDNTSPPLTLILLLQALLIRLLVVVQLPIQQSSSCSSRCLISRICSSFQSPHPTFSFVKAHHWLYQIVVAPSLTRCWPLFVVVSLRLRFLELGMAGSIFPKVARR